MKMRYFLVILILIFAVAAAAACRSAMVKGEEPVTEMEAEEEIRRSYGRQ